MHGRENRTATEQLGWAWVHAATRLPTQLATTRDPEKSPPPSMWGSETGSTFPAALMKPTRPLVGSTHYALISFSRNKKKGDKKEEDAYRK